MDFTLRTFQTTVELINQNTVTVILANVFLRSLLGYFVFYSQFYFDRKLTFSPPEAGIQYDGHW